MKLYKILDKCHGIKCISCHNPYLGNIIIVNNNNNNSTIDKIKNMYIDDFEIDVIECSMTIELSANDYNEYVLKELGWF